MKIVIVTGGFDPLHSGHISYFQAAKQLGDMLCVGVNSDEWLTRKKGRPFMPFDERVSIIENLSCVDYTFGFDDSDDTAIDAIRLIKELKEEFNNDKIIFANGGDRNKDNIPEMIFDDVEFVFGVGGGDKKNSSSWILKNWEKPVTQRNWGEYKILDSGSHWKVKELTFNTGKSLSDQRHFIRSEHWHVVTGKIRMELEYENGDKLTKVYGEGDSIDIPPFTWHRATNIGDWPARIIEVWLGNVLSEEDIERRE